MPSRINAVLARGEELGKLAKAVSDARDVFIWVGSPTLSHWRCVKAKRISYIHAEGYAAGG